ncbi:MAG: Uncharacterised protein [Candidatus Nitrosopelagicus brevis]|nr:MAG: Uncharacterised protein [Candidatus Nitrosopelagicus brevis]
MPIFLGVAPVQTITAFASYSSEPVKTLNGFARKSTFTTTSSIIVVFIRSACFLIVNIKSGPIIPSSNPG